MSNFTNVLQFHGKFGLLMPLTPGHLTKRKLQERIEFMQEELREFEVACGLDLSQRNPNRDAPQDLAAQADALIDLVYVAMGTAVMLGLPWEELWDDVQRANMAKVRGVTHRGHAVDVKKPEGWEPPDGLSILKAKGYDPDRDNHPDRFRDDPDQLEAYRRGTGF